MNLYKLTNKIGEYYVVANDPTEAIKKLIDILNVGSMGNGYGFSVDRKVTKTELLAEQITKINTGYDLTDNFLLL